MPAAGLRGGRRGEQLSLQPGGADPPDADDPLTPERRRSRTPGPRRTRSRRVGSGDQVRRLVRWADDTTTGDRAELDFEPHFRAWAMVSTTARECPGAFRCPSGRDCFAEDARARAAEADVVVVNTHLYGAHLASGGAVLPPHEVVVFDEAHEVEEVMTDSLGVEIGPGRFRALAATARPLLDSGPAGAADAADAVADLGDLLQRALRPLAGLRVAAVRPRWARARARTTGPGRTARTRCGPDSPARPRAARSGAGPRSRLEAVGPARTGPRRRPARRRSAGAPGLAQVLALAAGRVGRLVDALRRAEREAGDDEPAAARSRRDRVLLAAGHLAGDLARLAALTDDEVAWVDGGAARRACGSPPSTWAPCWPSSCGATVTGVLTSATVPLGSAGAAGAAPRVDRRARRGQPVRLPRTTPCCTWPSPCPTGGGPRPSPPSTTSSRH